MGNSNTRSDLMNSIYRRPKNWQKSRFVALCSGINFKVVMTHIKRIFISSCLFSNSIIIVD